MTRNAKSWKQWVRGLLAVVLLLDAGLVALNWRGGGPGSRAQSENRDKLRSQHAFLEADVRRARGIRVRIPEVQRECDRFFQEQLRPAGGGYSAVVSDLGEIAGRAGLRASSVSFRQQEIEKRGVVEVKVGATVDGDYASLARFINGLERSKNFYLMDSLSLGAATAGGGIKLNLELRTYFRS